MIVGGKKWYKVPRQKNPIQDSESCPFGYKVKATDFKETLLSSSLLIERPCLQWVSRTLWIMSFWLQGEGHRFLRTFTLFFASNWKAVSSVEYKEVSLSELPSEPLRKVAPLVTFHWFVLSAHFLVVDYGEQSYPQGYRVFAKDMNIPCQVPIGYLHSYP